MLSDGSNDEEKNDGGKNEHKRQLFICKTSSPSSYEAELLTGMGADSVFRVESGGGSVYALSLNGPKRQSTMENRLMQLEGMGFDVLEKDPVARLISYSGARSRDGCGYYNLIFDKSRNGLSTVALVHAIRANVFALYEKNPSAKRKRSVKGNTMEESVNVVDDTEPFDVLENPVVMTEPFDVLETPMVMTEPPDVLETPMVMIEPAVVDNPSLAAMGLAVETDELKAENDVLKCCQRACDEEIKLLNGKLDTNIEEIKLLNGKLGSKNEEIKLLTSKLDSNNKDIKLLNSKLDSNNDELRSMQGRLNAHTNEIAALNKELKNSREAEGRVDAQVLEIGDLHAELLLLKARGCADTLGDSSEKLKLMVAVRMAGSTSQVLKERNVQLSGVNDRMKMDYTEMVRMKREQGVEHTNRLQKVLAMCEEKDGNIHLLTMELRSARDEIEVNQINLVQMAKTVKESKDLVFNLQMHMGEQPKGGWNIQPFGEVQLNFTIACLNREMVIACACADKARKNLEDTKGVAINIGRQQTRIRQENGVLMNILHMVGYADLYYEFIAPRGMPWTFVDLSDDVKTKRISLAMDKVLLLLHRFDSLNGMVQTVDDVLVTLERAVRWVQANKLEFIELELDLAAEKAEVLRLNAEIEALHSLDKEDSVLAEGVAFDQEKKKKTARTLLATRTAMCNELRATIAALRKDAVRVAEAKDPEGSEDDSYDRINALFHGSVCDPKFSDDEDAAGAGK